MKEQIIKLREEGKTYKEITDLLNCSKATVAYHCGKDQKDKTRRRNAKNKVNTCACGNKKSKIATTCIKCNLNIRRKIMLDVSLNDSTLTYAKKHKFIKIRQIARKLLTEVRERKCEVCGFDIHVEACHIKPISKFSVDSLISEINSLDNLVWLCPNHHYMFDNGLLEFQHSRGGV